MSGDNKRAAVVHLVKSRGLKQVIVFSNTKITARLARQLERDGVKAESIHGDKTQADRMRRWKPSRPAIWKCWWPPTGRARWTWPACLASSTTCRTTPKTTCTVSAVPAARGRVGRNIALFTAEESASCSTSKADQARSAARHAGRARRPDRPQPWPWRGARLAARGSRGRDRGERGDRGDRGRSSSVDPSVARRIPRRASPWTISSSSPTSHRPPRRPERTRRSSRTAPSARSPCCSAAA